MSYQRFGLALTLAATIAAGCRDQEQEVPAPAAVPGPLVRAEHRASTRLKESTPVARQPAEVSVEIEGPSEGPLQLEPIAETEVHLVAVSRDLSWYEHLHPQRDGATWRTMLTFPQPGEYVLHTIFRPKNGTQIAEKKTVRVRGTMTGAARRELASSAREQRSGKYTIRLAATHEPPAAGVWNALTFHISRDGKAVTDLVPTGTLGHIVILRDGGDDFVYAHSTDGEAVGGIRGRAHSRASPSDAGADHARHVGDTGPEVTFHTQFPKTGRYRMWVAFRAGDDTIEADFVLDVRDARPPEHKD